MFEGLLRPMHLLVIFAIAMLICGPKKVGELGKGLGEAIRGFRQGVRDEPPPTTATKQTKDSDGKSTS
ncbi:MAG: twin-arginine translocase TatA/TatE family subunit [Terriglobales bacterium]